MKCPKCNNEINNEAIKFCPFCGTNLSEFLKNNFPQNMGPRNNPYSPKPPVRTDSNSAGKSSIKKIGFGILIALLLIALGVGGYFAASKFISDGNTKTSDKKSSEKDEDKENDKKKADKNKEHDIDEKNKKKDDKDEDAVSFSASSDTEEKNNKADDKENNAITFVPEDSDDEAAEEDVQNIHQAAGYVPDDTEDSDYLCYYASDRLLNDSDYQSVLSQHPETFPGNRTLAQMIENELFARHGYIFKAQELNDYFLQYSWYQNIRSTASCSNNQDVILRGMSSTEKSNIKFLDRYIPD